MIHIDPFKRFKAIKDAVNETLKFMRMVFKSILILSLRLQQRKQSNHYHQRNFFFSKRIYSSTTQKEQDSIKYCVIQSGTALRENKNIGSYKKDWLQKQ